MTIKRMYQSFRLWTIPGAFKRANWARKHCVYGAIGKNVFIMDRKVPLYANLIRFHNNIQIASDVKFITHDVIHTIYNRMNDSEVKLQENVGCIEIMDNVFVGSGTIILSNVRIGPNAIVAAGSVVTRDVPPNSVVGGVPAHVICTFDEYYKKHCEHQYPKELKPVKQSIDDKLANYMWDAFIKEREK